VFDPGQMLPVTIVRMIFFPFPARSDDGLWSLNWDLAVIHDCCEYSSGIKLRNGRAILWNLVEAGVVFLLLPMQIYPREFVFTHKEWPLFHLALKGTRARGCIFDMHLGDWQTTPASTMCGIQQTIKSVCSRGRIVNFLPFSP